MKLSESEQYLRSAAGMVALSAQERNWRIVTHGAAPGAHNMAVDEAIARAVAEKRTAPTLRFYQWEPACVSLGRNQPLASIDLSRCRQLGYDVVRRPTGGRAILHTDELTYSIAAPTDHPLTGGRVLDAYLRLAGGLVEGLRRLGIPAQAAPGSNRAGPDVSAACFEVPSAYEIIAGGRKVLGSAQSRRADYVLQHGSLPLEGDVTRLVDCLAFASEEERTQVRASLAEHAASLHGLTGRKVSAAHAADELAAGFRSTLGLELLAGDLTLCERQWAEELVRDKYAHTSWTGRL